MMDISSSKIKELKTTEEWAEAFSIMKQLRGNLGLDEYIALVADLSKSGYIMFALYDGESIVSLAGVNILANLVYGRYMWVQDLITDSKQRSKGYGKILIDYLQSYAEKHGCNVVALSSGLQRIDAHRFYQDKALFEKTSYVFKKRL